MFEFQRGAHRMRKLIFLFIILVVTACNLTPAPPTATATSVVNPATPTDTSVPPTATSVPHTVVDASTMDNKLMMGYQGWFTCPGDGADTGWFHWFRDNTPSASSLRVDMWPDTSEMTPDEHCRTQMQYPNGETAYLYSAFNPEPVMKHFQWMSDYGIDGVFLQRFGTELLDPHYFNERNVVTQNVRAGAEAYGRVFAIMYDTSGMDSSNFVTTIENDWRYMVDTMHITESAAYLHHNGKPMVAIWGLGFIEHPGTPQQAMELVNFFEHNPDSKYQATIMGGVPTWWRLLNNDSQTDPAWADLYCALNIISPWTVGRYSSDSEVDSYKTVMQADMVRATQCGAQYMPVVYPGTAFHNDHVGGSAFNLIPRRGGNLYWRQVYNAVSIGAPMIYNAMFDEVDEDTAMYKVAATTNDQPMGVDLLSMDADGIHLPNDWYLCLAGAATKMLRSEIPLTNQIPINRDCSAVAAIPTIPPTPIIYKMRIIVDTTADWTNFSLLSGGQWLAPQIISSSPEASNASADASLFSLNQSLDRAKAGKHVEMVVEVALTDIQAGQELTFVIKRGSIGKTTVTLQNAIGAQPVTVKTIEWSGIAGSTGENPKQFTVLSDAFMSAK